jgi:acyl-coenzyme A synthetase/AMP-(fatty) acid ligase
MAYKVDDETILNAYEGVSIGESNSMLNISSPFVATKVLSGGIKEVALPFQTEDIVEIINDSEFKLLGRSSNLAKIAGKRISTLHIESIIESLEDIDAAMIRIRRDDKALKDEILDIYVESRVKLESKVLKALLKESLGSINIPFKIHNHKKILRSSVGKKIGYE